jgi:ABC-type bacteriocin/lantibiotic exporter with double-glycine peptidase domain
LPKPPHFFQIHPSSCVPACLKMVLASLDFEISELELRDLCECDETGTQRSKAINAIEKLGFIGYEANLEIEELEEIISNDLTPITFLKFDPKVNYSHAVVVYKISSENIFVLDPAIGEREFDINLFVESWSRGLTIIIERKLE